jgi:nucleoid DNA-binding protein
MTKQQLIDAIAEETSKPKADIESTLEALTRKIGNALAS